MKPWFIDACLALCLIQPSAAADLLIREVRVLSPGEPAQERRDVEITGGHIVAIHTHDPARHATRVIDGRGRTLVRGLIDSHVHLANASGLRRPDTARFTELYAAYQAQLPRSHLFHGFTTVVDLQADADTVARLQATALAPRVLHCGPGLPLARDFQALDYPPGQFLAAYPNYLHDRHTQAQLPAGEDPARHTPQAVVAALAGEGARCIKLVFEEALWWPGAEPPDFDLPSLPILREVVAAAHARQLPVLLHATTPRGQQLALDAGVDVLAHGLWEWPGAWNAAQPPAALSELAQRVARSGIALQPTFRVLRNDEAFYDPAFLDGEPLRRVLPPALIQHLKTDAQGQRALAHNRARRIAPKVGLAADAVASPAALQDFFRRYNARYEALIGAQAAAGQRLLFGSDTATGGLGWGHPPGLKGRLEMDAWQRAGIPLATLFEALTLGNARAFGLEQELGRVRPGWRADLLLLGADPLQTLQAYDRIEWVIRDGQAIPRGALAADRP